jgi:ribosomal protein S18 acetylase RimI-like enzyme/fructosamine-3-kinase
MLIRFATLSDIPQLSTLKHPKDESHLQVYKKSAEEKILQAQSNDALFLVLEEERKILGQVFLKLTGNETQPGFPNMQDVYVLEKQRGKGLGKKLIEECERISKDKGYKKISVAVNPTLNHRAKFLYERLGYKDTGDSPYLDGVYDGEEDWAIDMVKVIDTPSTKPWKVDKEKLKKIARNVVNEVFGEDVVELKSIADLGEVNYTLYAKTDTRPFIIRLNGGESIERFQREKWAAERAAEIGVLTPKILYVGEMDGVAVSIVTYIEGLNGKFHQKKTEIWEQLGKYARQIHSVSVKGFGENLIDEGTYQFGNSWQRFVQYNIDSLNPEDKLLVLGVLDSETSSQLKETFSNLLTFPFQFGLCHGDLSEKNTIVDSDGKVWLIDWGCVHAQVVPHFDLWSIMDWSIKPGTAEFTAFLRGYGLTEKEFQEMRLRVLDFALLQATDKLRWAIDKSPEKVQSFSDSLKRKLRVRFG